MEEVWERAVETALDGQTDCASVRSLTLDGVVKCIHGRLPPSGLLERFRSLEHLSISNVGVSSLEKFPCLPYLQKLTLSDNRIAAGLEFLVESGLASLRDLDLSNNRIQFIEDLAPLAQLKLVSLDLYECPVTRVKHYRSSVFSMIKSLKYLDKMDADGNERPESDDEEEDEEEEDDDPGSGEVDIDNRAGKSINGPVTQGVVDVDEEEESDADEEENETARGRNRPDRISMHHLSNGFHVAAVGTSAAEGEFVAEDMEDEDDLGEEVDEEEGDDDVVEVHEIDDSEEDEDGVEEDEEEDEEGEDDVDDVEPGSIGRLDCTEGEIDGHEQGEEDENGDIGEEDELVVEEEGDYEEDEEENGEIGEEDEQGIEEDGDCEEDGEGEDEEEDVGSEYLVRPVRQAEEDAGSSHLDAGNEDEDEDEGEEVDEVEDEEDNGLQQPQLKRQRTDGDNSKNANDSMPAKVSRHP